MMNLISFAKIPSRVLSAGIFSFALLAVGCGDDDSSILLPEESSSSVEEILSSAEPQSSSMEESSSSEQISSSSQKSGPTAWDYMNPGLSYGELVDSRDNKVYKTLNYGKFNWMAENLNYDIGDTLHTWCARENCELFGRLYTFAAAMDSAKSGCGVGSVCEVPDNFQGICPEGWHVLEKSETEMFWKFRPELSRAGAPKWEDSLNTNVYGLTLLPAGYAYVYPDETMNLQTWSAYFWTSDDYTDSTASIFNSRQDDVFEVQSTGKKRNGYSVRCVENYEHVDPLVDPSSVKKGEFTDERDGQVYSKVTIGKQTWMAENLNYADSVNTPLLQGRVKPAYINDPDSNKLYGLLYTWAAAMDSGAFDYSFLDGHISQQNIRGICPEGWHLPTRMEFEELLESIGGGYKNAHALKARYGWDDNPGDDEYGFALVGAGRVDTTTHDIYATYGGAAYLWTADVVYERIFRGERAYVYTLDERHVVYNEYVTDTTVFKIGFNSIRCIMD